jgi:hypothetical protein
LRRPASSSGLPTQATRSGDEPRRGFALFAHEFLLCRPRLPQARHAAVSAILRQSALPEPIRRAGSHPRQRCEPASRARGRSFDRSRSSHPERWRVWWTKQLPRTSLWQSLRGQFDRPVDEALLPMSLLERFTSTSAECRLRDLLGLLRTVSQSGPMRARLTLVS